MKCLCRLGGQRPHGIAILALALCYCLAGNASTAPILQDTTPAQSQPATSQLQDELEQTLRLLQEERLIRTQTTMREHLTEADAQGPALAWSLNDAALILAKEGKLEMAQAIFERALEIVETHFDPKHPARGTLLQHLGDVLLLRRDPAAVERYREAAIVFETVAGPSHPRLASVLNGLATALGSLGQVAEAEELYRRSIRMYEEQDRYPRKIASLLRGSTSVDADPLDLVAPLHNLALLLLNETRLAESEALLAQAYRILKRNDRLDAPQAIPVLRALAKIKRAAGNIAMAESFDHMANRLEPRQVTHAGDSP